MSLNIEQIGLGVVVPSFDSRELLQKCIASIKSSALAANLDIVIAVVDCHPKSLDRNISDNVDEYYTLPKNPGFGSAANFGFQKLLGHGHIKKILLLNPDAELHIDFFKIYLQMFEIVNASNPVSPKILFSNNMYKLKISEFEIHTILRPETLILEEKNILFNSSGQRKNFSESNFDFQPDDILVFSKTSKLFSCLTENNRIEANLVNNAGSFYNWPDIAGDIGFEELDTGQYDGNIVSRLSWCGAAVILDREYIQKLSGFDERFFLYYEDTEFALRGTRIGLPPNYAPNLIVKHHHSASTRNNPKQRAKWIWESRALFSMIETGLLNTLILLIARFVVGIKRKGNRSIFKILQSYLVAELLWSLRGIFKFYRFSSKNRLP